MTLEQLKSRARALYRKAEAFGDLDCGRQMAEALRPDIGLARREFSRVWAEVKRLDPTAPDDPYAVSGSGR